MVNGAGYHSDRNLRPPIDGVLYPTAEHWMMASKARMFGDTEALEQIPVAPDPKSAKALGRQVKNFEEAVWKASARRLVTEGNIAKFQQNLPLRDFLLSTGDAVLVEASPRDWIWGIALDRTIRRLCFDTWHL